MTSQNVLKPINCNVREPDASPLSKRPRREFSYSINSEHHSWSLSAGHNELDILAEMGLAMLDSDELSDCKSEDDFCRPSSSTKINIEHSDINQDFMNLISDYTESTKMNESSKESAHSASQFECRQETPLRANSWEHFCLNKRSSMMNQDSKDWFKCLSDEIILMIFRWVPKVSLTRCALVCKRWHQLSADETLWTRLDCSLKVLEPGALGHILSRQVMILKLSQAEILDPPILPNVKAYLDQFKSKLMYLDLSMASISTNSLAAIFKRCSRLRKLSLESCSVDDEVFLQLNRNEHLEVLNLTMVEGLTTQGIEYIVSSLHKLKELNISWTGLSVESLTLLCGSLPSSLSRLNLSGCRKTLNVSHVKNLVTYCPHLRELDLSDGTHLSNETIKHICMLKELNFLALSRCYRIQCSALKTLTHMTSLQYLDVHGTHIEPRELEDLQNSLGNKVQLNKFMFSSIARPTVGVKRSSIWGLRVRD